MHLQVIQNHFLIVKQPMLQFKKDILTEIGKRQDIDKITAGCNAEITVCQHEY